MIELVRAMAYCTGTSYSVSSTLKAVYYLMNEFNILLWLLIYFLINNVHDTKFKTKSDSNIYLQLEALCCSMLFIVCKTG